MSERARDAGFTLAEVLVTMMVMSVLGLAVVSTVSTVGRNTSAASNQIKATTRAQLVSDRLTKYVRAAHLSSTSPETAFTVADANHVTFLTDFGDPTGPRQLDVAVSGTSGHATLTETFRLADSGSDGSGYTYNGPATTRILTAGNLDTAGGAVFTFYGPSGAVLTPPLTAAEDTTRISRVRITLTMHEPGVGAPVTASTLVYLRNVQYR